MADNHFKIHKGLTVAPQALEPSNPVNGDVYYDSTLGAFRLYQDGDWIEVGTGTGGGKNYFDYGQFERSGDVTNNVTSYDDGGAYVDGTGGSPTLISFSHTTSASEVLAGEGSLKFSRIGGTPAGEGISFLTQAIDRADQGKVLYGSMEIDFTDANYTSGEVVLHAYDVSNAQELVILNDVNGEIPASKGIYQFAVQTLSNTGQIRLSLHIPSTIGSVTWDAFIDDVKLGPATPVGIPDRTAFEIKYLSSNITSTTNPISDLTFDNLVIGRTYRITITGYISSTDGSSGTISILHDGGSLGILRVDGPSGSVSGSASTVAKFKATDTTLTFSFSDQTGSTLNGNGTRGETHAILEDLSAGGVISTTENLFQTAEVFGEGNDGSAVLSTTDINWTEVSDNLGAWDGQIFTAPKDMVVLVQGAINTTTAVARTVFAYVNGTQEKIVQHEEDATQNRNIVGLFKLNKGDQLSFRLSASATLNNSTVRHWISIKALPDFSTFTVTGEKARAKIYESQTSGTNGGTSQTSYTQRVLNTIEEYGPSFATLSSNRFTLQPGVYAIDASAPALRASSHKIKLVSDPAGTPVDEIIGTVNFTNADSSGEQTRSFIKGFITITSAKTFEIQHRVDVSVSSNGWGVSAGYGDEEIYTQVEIVKIA